MYQKIMVPLDGSELAECVMPHLETIARSCESPEVILVRVVEPIAIPYGRELAAITSERQLKAFETHHRAEAKKYLKKIAARLGRAGIKARTEVINGRAAEALTSFVTDNGIDLLVIATHGRSGISRWVWGSVADRLLRSVCVPVFMVRAPGC